ncbi:MAG TPA: ABC transporter permease, partial [Vicinamibacterales bacterium]
MSERLYAHLFNALRSLVATPVTSLATVVMLVVAVGANLAVFGLIDRAILTPARHVVRPDRLFTLAFAVPDNPGRGAGMTTTSYVAFDTIREHVPALAQVAAWRRTSTTAIVAGEQTRVESMLVSGSYFEMLGAVPRLGRVIQPQDDQASGSTAVISHAFWRSAFGGDPAVLGRRIAINRIDYVVSGVMPAGFSGHSSTRVDVWVPMAAAMRETPGWNLDSFRNVVGIVARVEKGQDVAVTAQASVALDRVVSLIALDAGEVAPAERRIAYALAGVSILVLIIGLANAATLLLVRGTRQQREAAIRTALGATRGRLFAQVLAEASILAVISTAGALALASWLGEVVRRVLLAGVIEHEVFTLRTIVVAVAAGLGALALAAAVGVSQLPRHVRAGDLSGASDGARRSRAYPMLLLVQTTLSVVLMAGAGLFGRSLYNLRAQDFGMRLSDVVLVGFEPGPNPVAGQAELFRAAL